jgi:hypothetical protein
VDIEPVPGEPGYATVDLGIATGLDHFNFSLRRDDGRFLGSDGRWHPTAQFLSPRKLENLETTTRFQVGPTIVNAIDEEEAVVLEIRGTDHRLRTIWPSLPRSSGKSNTDDPFGGQADPSSIDGVTSGKPKGSTEKKDEKKEPDQDKREQIIEKVEDEKEKVEEPGGDPPPPEPGPAPWKWPVLILGLLLLVGGVAVWFATRPSPVVAVAPADPAPEDGKLTELNRLRTELKDLVAERGDVGKIADAAKRLIESGKPEFQQDGIRGLYAAASRGSADAQLAMAKLFDPRYFQSGNTAVPEPDPAMAADQYSQAEQGGSNLAGDELRGLCGFLRQRGADGSALPQPCRE